ncbi:hypothetical protein ACROYT_G000915 [Oculina patagonica]
MEAPDYYPEVDPFEDMDVDNLFDEPVMPQNEKQIVPKPPTYEESLKDLLEGNKEIYVDPQYFPEYEYELPPEYDEDEIDYALDADDEVQMLADGATTGANRITVINGAHSLIAHMMIKSAGKIVYDTDNLHKVTFVKNLLEYSDDFSRSVAKNSLWYLDTDHRIANANQNAGFEARRLLTTGLNDVNVVIPLNRYSFFEELEGRMLLPMQLQFNIQLQNDAELLKKADDVADGRVVLNRFLLWVPKLTPKDSLYDKFVSSFLVKNTWTYMREMYEVSAPTNSSGFFQISSSIDNVKAIFVYLQRAKSNNADENPYEFDTYNINLDRGNGSYLTTCRLEYGNGVFYPETEYDSESKVRIFNDLMSYGMRKNDYNSGTQLNLANYNSLYPIIFFDLSYQAERVTRDPKQLIFRYKLNANSAGDSPFNVHAIVLYDETIVIDKVGNELVIV